MNAKLTLSLNEKVINEAKNYAKGQSTSLSKLIENYLQSLTKESRKKNTVSPLVESLTGIIPNEVNEREEYRDYIDKKYS